MEIHKNPQKHAKIQKCSKMHQAHQNSQKPSKNVEKTSKTRQKSSKPIKTRQKPVKKTSKPVKKRQNQSKKRRKSIKKTKKRSNATLVGLTGVDCIGTAPGAAIFGGIIPPPGIIPTGPFIIMRLLFGSDMPPISASRFIGSRSISYAASSTPFLRIPPPISRGLSRFGETTRRLRQPLRTVRARRVGLFSRHIAAGPRVAAIFPAATPVSIMGSRQRAGSGDFMRHRLSIPMESTMPPLCLEPDHSTLTKRKHTDNDDHERYVKDHVSSSYGMY